jgi:hypothetical protein
MARQLGLRFGLLVIASGVLLDAVAHGIGDLASAHLGHVVVIVGMVLSLTGVVIDGIRQPVRSNVRAANKEVSRALR